MGPGADSALLPVGVWESEHVSLNLAEVGVPRLVTPDWSQSEKHWTDQPKPRQECETRDRYSGSSRSRGPGAHQQEPSWRVTWGRLLWASPELGSRGTLCRSQLEWGTRDRLSRNRPELEEPGQVPVLRGQARLPAPPCAAHLSVELSRRSAGASADRAPRAATSGAAGATGGRLRLAWKGEVGELELGALRVGAEQLGLLGVQEGERLRAGPVRLYAHGAAAQGP